MRARQARSSAHRGQPDRSAHRGAALRHRVAECRRLRTRRAVGAVGRTARHGYGQHQGRPPRPRAARPSRVSVMEGWKGESKEIGSTVRSEHAAASECAELLAVHRHAPNVGQAHSVGLGEVRQSDIIRKGHSVREDDRGGGSYASCRVQTTNTAFLSLGCQRRSTRNPPRIMSPTSSLAVKTSSGGSSPSAPSWCGRSNRPWAEPPHSVWVS